MGWTNTAWTFVQKKISTLTNSFSEQTRPLAVAMIIASIVGFIFFRLSLYTSLLLALGGSVLLAWDDNQEQKKLLDRLTEHNGELKQSVKRLEEETNGIHTARTELQAEVSRLQSHIDHLTKGDEIRAKKLEELVLLEERQRATTQLLHSHQLELSRLEGESQAKIQELNTLTQKLESVRKDFVDLHSRASITQKQLETTTETLTEKIMRIGGQPLSLFSQAG